MRENFPVDPDSIIYPQQPPLLQQPACDGEYIEELRLEKKPACIRCPHAKADSQNEKYAVFIRSCFCGRRSELSLMTCCLYQSVKFGCCSDELCATLYSLAEKKISYLKLLGDLLCSLGGDPKFFCAVSSNSIAGSWWNASPSVIRYPCNLGEGLEQLLTSEKETLEEYKSIKAYVDDNGIKAALTDIICEKEKDISDLSLLYTRFCS